MGYIVIFNFAFYFVYLKALIYLKTQKSKRLTLRLKNVFPRNTNSNFTYIQRRIIGFCVFIYSNISKIKPGPFIKFIIKCPWATSIYSAAVTLIMTP